jgi:hypothetical protein
MEIKKKEYLELKQAYEKSLADVVIKLNRIEVQFEDILLEVLKPDRSNYDFIRTTFFNNSYISFGSKFGLVQNILQPKGWKKKDFDPIHSLIRIRNTFAHSNLIYVTASQIDNNDLKSTSLQLRERKSEKVSK